MKSETTNARWVGWVVVCAAMALLLAGSASLWTYTVDDAWITFRYARNAAHGLGVVYNAGQRVEGFTSPTWFVMALGAEMSGALPLLILAGHTPLLVGIVCGLEAAASAALIGGVLLLASEERVRWRPLAVIGVMALLTRPENAGLLAALGAIMWATRRGERRELIRVGGALVVAFSILIVARWWYFGRLVPNTAVAKIRPDGGAMVAGWNYVCAWGIRYWWMAALAVPAFFVRGARRTAWHGAVLIAAQVAFVFVAGGDWMPQWRFMLPVGVVLVVMACAGAKEIAPDGRWRAGRIVGVTAVALGLAAQLWMFRMDRWRIDYERREQSALDEGPVRYVADRAGANDCIAARDIGILGYRANCEILDLVGLTDPTIAAGSGYRRRDRIDRDYVFGRRPSYLLLQSEKPVEGPPGLDRISRELVKDERFGGYRLARRFELPGRHFCEVYERASGTPAIAARGVR
jgi:arabinofuranosyltransferase